LVGVKAVTVRFIVFLVPWIIHKNSIGCRRTAKKDPIHCVDLQLGTSSIAVFVMMEVTEGEERKPSYLVWAYTMNEHEKMRPAFHGISPGSCSSYVQSV
jgi:hypothetical protein